MSLEVLSLLYMVSCKTMWMHLLFVLLLLLMTVRNLTWKAYIECRAIWQRFLYSKQVCFLF